MAANPGNHVIDHSPYIELYSSLSNVMIAWLRRFCSHKLLKGSVTGQKQIDQCKFRVCIIFSSQVMRTLMDHVEREFFNEPQANMDIVYIAIH